MNSGSSTGQPVDWLKTYRVKARRYDELRDDQKLVRPQWAALMAQLERQGQEGAQHGITLARNLIAENGVTYNVYADPKGADRPWTLDSLPVIVTHEEWRSIEAGMLQRARLMEAILADLYGPQRLLAEGLVPPELVYGHPNFLWQCRGTSPLGGHWLPVYAADLARAPDGQWWVLSDRTQTPSGAGYALENRQITSRVHGDVFRQLRVQPIHNVFVGLREQMLSGIEDEAPLAVVLTPGAFNETYFEHAYLARQLGMLLVEGHDLTVRGDTLYLKTLKGLKRVHAVLRRLDDDFCDPVELRSDSALGIPGLLQVVRAGRVVLANPLGTGVMQSAGWMGFLPGVAEWLLEETLSLPSVATWWCGEKPALEYVIKHIEELVIKPTYPNQRYQVGFGAEMDEAQRAELFERMRKRPHAYVAQERFALSQVPVWRERSSGLFALTAKAMTLRVYAVATPDGYRIMPGGLARIAGESSADLVSSQLGGGSKDVWILPSEEQSAVVPELRSVRPSARHAELPSSTGENLFWLGRYNERLENKVRLLRASLAIRTQPEVFQLAIATCRQFGLQAGEGELALAMLDANNPNSLRADYKRLSWCATQVRSRLSLEHWRTLNVLRRQLRDADQAQVDARESLDWMLLSLAALSGFALDDLHQDEGWHLLRLGRRLERTQFLCDLLLGRLQSGLVPTQAELEWWLELNGSIVAYRSRYMTSPRLSLVLDLLLRDAANPRALAHQRDTIHGDLLQLADMVDAKLETQLGAAIAAVLDLDFGVLEGQGQGASYARQSLSATLAAVSDAVRRLSDDLSLQYFSHVEREVQMMEI